jgi:hypothetical protein
MSEPKFIKATPGPKHSVIYETEDGRKFSYSKGNWTWRNNNPGNLVVGKVSKRNGAIGKAGGFAVFPDYETGHKTHLDCLRTTYRNHRLEDMIKGYAPPKENKTEIYLEFLRKKTGVKDDTKVKDFTDEAFEKLWQAIEQMEGLKKGTVKECTESKKEEKAEKKKITGVQRNKKKTITFYRIETLGWVSKAEGIRLTLQGKVDAVVAHSRSGSPYLRTRPDKSITDNLDAMPG